MIDNEGLSENHAAENEYLSTKYFIKKSASLRLYYWLLRLPHKGYTCIIMILEGIFYHFKISTKEPEDIALIPEISCYLNNFE